MAPSTIIALVGLLGLVHGACISGGNQDTINQLFQSGGADTIVQLCPGSTIDISDSVVFTAAGQEISTQGYPTDSTRATIIIQPGTNATSAIRGNWQNNVRVLNIQVDGNRPNAGLFVGDALLEMGGGTTGQTVSHIVAKNTRSWSCMHFIESGIDSQPCKGASITFNEIGPCGDEGVSSQNQAQWADGMSIACTASTVTDNTIVGPTDGGIVLFGAPGTQVLRNNITSSSTNLGYGAINLVDYLYGGNYSGVVVSDNTITGVGKGLFNLGIAMGSFVWSNPHPQENFGPVTVTNNVFSGNVGFSIAINGWYGGLTTTGNDVSAVHAPTSDFADASGCGGQIQSSFSANEQLVVYAPGVQGASNIQSNFQRTPNNGTNWLCLTHPLPPKPAQQTFQANTPSVTAQQSTVVDLLNFHVQFQADGNLVGLDTTNGVWTAKWATSTHSSACGSDGAQCFVAFGSDGNLVMYDANGPYWASNTAGRGHTITYYNAAPWLTIADASGNQIWAV